MKFVSGIEAAADLAARFAVEAGHGLFFGLVLLHDVVLRDDRIIAEIRECVEIEGFGAECFTGSSDVGEDLRIRVGKAQEHVSLRARPLQQFLEHGAR